ncbi:MAG TPA: FixH family protein [Chloroflexaceae bacterium]|nr:FixH family protein [Chloroflexaceae bacterium]
MSAPVSPPRGRRPAPALLALALLALVALAACAPADRPPARYEQTVDGLTIGIEATESPRLNASERLLVTLTDAGGRPVDGADVYVDLDMPAMPMGTNRPIAEPQGQGRYLASTAYTMLGEWELTVVAEVDDREHRAVFEITAVE